MSYSFDNTNKDLAVDIADDSNPPGAVRYEYALDDFSKANPGWKYCMSALWDPNPNEPIDSNHSGNIQNAYHGELYFNTYGGIDGQCNDNWDCEFGGCEGV